MYDANKKDTKDEGGKILNLSRGEYNRGIGLITRRKWIQKKNSARATALGMRAGEGKLEAVDIGVCMQQERQVNASCFLVMYSKRGDWTPPVPWWALEGEPRAPTSSLSIPSK